MNNLNRFYFTYGSEGHPFKGGWTIVHATSATMAEDIFRREHPDKVPGALNCCCMYPEKRFAETQMSKGGNLGNFCHEELWP